MEHLQRVWHASRERLPFQTPGSVPILGLANAPIVETKFLELAMSLLDFSSRIPLGTFSILLNARSRHFCYFVRCLIIIVQLSRVVKTLSLFNMLNILLFAVNTVIARGKPTSQSTVYKNNNWADSGNAVDGSALLDNGDCTMRAFTDDEDRHPWWRVDLEHVYRIVQIMMIGRPHSST